MKVKNKRSPKLHTKKRQGTAAITTTSIRYSSFFLLASTTFNDQFQDSDLSVVVSGEPKHQNLLL